jgi:hypothetical protein
VRRTTTHDCAWPDGFDGPVTMVARGRDLLTTAAGEAVTLDAARLDVAARYREGMITEVRADPPHPGTKDLAGPFLFGGFRRALDNALPGEGLTPDKDYKPVFSGKHDQSILGVNSGDYDAGAVASDVFHRMGVRGQIKESDFRIIYRSQKFPTSSFAYAHDLEPKLVDKMLTCFYNYRFPPEMVKAFDGADRFFPINYKTTWEVVRAVAKGSGGGFDKATYDKEAKREADEAAAKAKKKG